MAVSIVAPPRVERVQFFNRFAARRFFGANDRMFAERGEADVLFSQIIGDGAAITVGQGGELRRDAQLRQFQVAQLGLKNFRLPRGIKIADDGLQ